MTDDKADPKREGEAKPKAAAKPASSAETEGEAKPKPEAKPKGEGEGKAEAKPKGEGEAKPKPEAEAEQPRKLPVVQPEAQLTKRPTGNVVGQAWLVLVLAVGFGSALAALEYQLGPQIAQNKLDESLSQVPELVPGAVRGEPDDAVVAGKRVFRAFDAASKLVGWVVPGRGAGFADKVEILIGLNAEASELTGVFVLDQKETPGLGDNITTKEFRDRFIGFSTKVDLDAQQAPTDRATGVVKALTGATISSDTVCRIVNETVDLVEGPLSAAAGTGASQGDT